MRRKPDGRDEAKKYALEISIFLKIYFTPLFV